MTGALVAQTHIPDTHALIDEAEVFLDTNIIIYAANGRFDEPKKHACSQELLTRKFGTSAQVLAEFYSNVIRKGDVPLSSEDASKWVNLLSKKPFQPVDASIVKEGIAYSKRHRISCWDGAIIAAAERLGAGILYTEDLSHGQTYGSIRACNPFIEDFLA